MAQVDWKAWHSEPLDALVAVLEGSQVNWATNPQGEPWIVVGDRESSGLEYPACFIPAWSKSRDSTESSRSSELHTIEARLLVLQKGDVKQPQASLREALNFIAEVENALYANRSLNGTCRSLWVAKTTPFAGVGPDSSLEGGEIQLSILKTAATS